MESLTRRDVLRIGAGLGAAAGIGTAGRMATAGEEPAKKAFGGKVLRVGQIGVGGRGSGLLEEVLGSEGVEVVAICDLDERRRERAMDRAEKACGKRPDGSGDGPYDYRRLLARKDVDCVVIATPCYWHSTMYIDALKAGMHFYGEKPLSITAEGVRRCLEAKAAHPEVAVQIGFQWGAHQGRKEVFRKIGEGAIGELLQGRFQRLNDWDGHTGWYADKKLSGDWMLEQAVHEFNLIWSAIRAHPLRAYAAGGTGVIPNRDTTNYYTAILTYPGRLVVHYTHGWIEVPGFPGGGLRTEFIGTKGAADIMGAYLQLRQAPAGGSPRIQPPGAGETKEHFANFFECVRSKTPEKTNCGVENGAGASIIGLMIRQSLEAKREVTFEETMKDDRRPPVPAEPA
jgi:myo-inositol 2-dehydrogenase/D-chiro-inositol 1-dehydrogenase